MGAIWGAASLLNFNGTNNFFDNVNNANSVNGRTAGAGGAIHITSNAFTERITSSTTQQVLVVQSTLWHMKMLPLIIHTHTHIYIYIYTYTYYLMAEKAIWLDIARVCGRIFICFQE